MSVATVSDARVTHAQVAGVPGVIENARVARQEGRFVVQGSSNQEPVERIGKRVTRDGAGLDRDARREFGDPDASRVQRLALNSAAATRAPPGVLRRCDMTTIL